MGAQTNAITLAVSPHGTLHVEPAAEDAALVPELAGKRIAEAFAESASRGLLHLATVELQAHLPPAFGFARDFARDYLTRLSRMPPRG